ncbi:Cyclic nucleotide-binding protein [Pseudocohnilembus persalinus]|uniref:Cyclic nucleotide-binding protein n=1 Tax=Pseudocohnilembus persalinus TaxID=266149 RepID=A0A0V0QE76_PSEPJ|nr:Cyclic nucleotide-binding protein [Pseudocohnilembus persalinus]|eukprot:KRX00497.1 Cyclic nucleotide-binding protein [Pseudocohnilembus persalinus]
MEKEFISGPCFTQCQRQQPYVTQLEPYQDNNWIVHSNLQDSPPFTQYIQSYYWAIATIMLIGTKGQTDIETVFTILSLLVTVGYFAKILGQVQMVMDQMEQQKKAYKQEKEIMNSFFNIHSDLSIDLQKGHKKKQISVQFDSLTNTFPEELQEMLQKERYQEQIKKFKMLNNIFSQKVIKKLIMVVKGNKKLIKYKLYFNYFLTYLNVEEYYMPNQIIFQRDVMEESKLYLLIEGQIELYQETGEIDSTLKVIQPGDIFGTSQFFTNQAPYHSSRSCQNSFSTALEFVRRL